MTTTMQRIRKSSGLGLGVIVIGCVMMILCQGCSTTFTNSAADNSNSGGWLSSDFDAALAELPVEKSSAVESAGIKVEAPKSLPFGNDGELRRVYAEWYQKGYGFGLVTGTKYLPDPGARHDSLEIESAKVWGWLDGTSDGSLANTMLEKRVLSSRSR